MKYVALLSGGKDSCFNLIHCRKNGHQLIAAASLGPEPGKEELDSFLYQTVGQDAIEFVARALDVPLYRHIIKGEAIEQGAEYGMRNKNAKEAGGVRGDETEDLYELLSAVKVAHPDVQGVSVGAILSNYQRVRVEHVCSRLGLTSLAYLWRRDQAELLNEMIDAGMEAILIKVAGIGLTTKHLGKSLAQMQPLLTKLNNLYGSHVCGEGGEYESLTLDCPLFKKRIVLKDVETVIHSDNDFATVAYMRIKDAYLEPKEPTTTDVEIPSLLEEEFAYVKEQLDAEEHSFNSQGYEASSVTRILLEPTSRKVGSWVSVCNVQASELPEGSSFEDEVTRCFSILQGHLEKYNLKVANCTNINIYISSMDLFSHLNSIYGTYFGTSPPSRACVAVDLPSPIRVRLDCSAFIEGKPGDRQALHVQGLSYWAPANIGPYSQAIIAEERISISGQIGLIPSNLTLPSPTSFPTEFALSSQHVSRVINALKNGWDGITQSTTYFLDDTQNLNCSKKGHRLLEVPQSPTLFVVVKSLPKNAIVEKQVLVHTGRREIKDEEGEISIEGHEMIFKQGNLLGDDSKSYYESLKFEDGHSCCSLVFVQGQDLSLLNLALRRALLLPEQIISARLYHRTSVTSYLSEIIGECGFPVTPVPCRSISSLDNDEWGYAVHIIAN